MSNKLPRAVTADHILFNECIEAFRPSESSPFPTSIDPSHSYILTDFHLTNQWNLPECTVLPSKDISLSDFHSAFICKIKNPERSGIHNSHLYGIALTTIITFATGRLCKSPRDDTLSHMGELREKDYFELSLTHPVLVGGIGSVDTDISEGNLQEFEANIVDLISKLNKLPHKKYTTIMEAMRLIHLSHANKKDDFGLAYLLVISAIEAVSQHAIKRDKFKKKHLKETEWTSRAKLDEEFAELLQAYIDARSSKYLKERYVNFITTYAPQDRWESAVPHPQQAHVDRVKVHSNILNLDFITKQQWHEKYPSDLKPEEINEILFATYDHRSLFIHTGSQPPHEAPTSLNRFFQSKYIRKGDEYIEQLLPNYELLVGISRMSILNWIDTL